MSDTFETSRRGFLSAGLGAALGVTFNPWSWANAADPASPLKAKRACILLWLSGGPSQFETWNPKSDSETGGPFKAISTSVAGIQIGEHLPLVAKEMKDLALIRSMKTQEGSHWRASYQAHTGYRPQESLSVQHPSFGSIVSSELGDPRAAIPSFVSVGGVPMGGGFLGQTFNPFVIDDPLKSASAFGLKGGVANERFQRRLKLVGGLDQDFARARGEAEVKLKRRLYARAQEVLKSSMAKTLDLSQEKRSLRQRYGASKVGQGCLLARRLVEGGIPFVEVMNAGWDTHADNFGRHKRLLGALDPAFSTLIADLRQRGLLESTLVLCMGEFGRTPKINGRKGRDHYPHAWSAALAGGGIKGGQVIGATDAKGVKVTERPVKISDLFATVGKALGVETSKTHSTAVGPVPLVAKEGKVVKELLG